MISVEYCQLLARYNRWMNERLYAVVGEFSVEERTRDRGAFFGSMHRTLNHILWGDRIWLSRFKGEPYTVRAFGADMYADFAELARERAATDTAILDWAGQLAARVARRDARIPRGLRWQAAPRGELDRCHAHVPARHASPRQLATLIKQAGKDTGTTDLPWMPGVMKVLD